MDELHGLMAQAIALLVTGLTERVDALPHATRQELRPVLGQLLAAAEAHGHEQAVNRLAEAMTALEPRAQL